MERIKQAVEKARRQQHRGQSSSSRGVAVADNPEPALVITPQINCVEYTGTRVVPLDVEHLRRRRIISFNKNDPMTGVFDILRTKVLQQMNKHGWRTLAVTSPTSEAGKTVVAINLAMSIAHQTQTTAMLVDFDLRRPRIGDYLGIPPGKSLNEIFGGDAAVPEALVNPSLPRLVVLPANQPIQKSSETLSSPKVGHLIQELRERYDERIVIFDLPPLLNNDDAIAVLPRIDCILLVVADGMSSPTELEQCKLHLSSGNLVGVVLNKGEVKLKQYY